MCLLVGICLLSLQCVLAADSGAIQWYKDIDRASMAARKTNKPMLLDFSADWCAPCKVMEEEVYSDKDLIEVVTRKFVPVKINFDRQRRLAAKYNVNALPYIVFTDSYGGELLHWNGLVGAKNLTEILKALPGDVSEINRFHGMLNQGKDNFEALEGMGQQLRATGLYLVSNEYYGKALKNEQAIKIPAKREWILLEMGLNYLALRQSREAMKTFEAGVKEFPNSERITTFQLGLGQAYAMGGKKDRARKLLEAFIREHPGGAESEKAKALLDSL
ncbi:MAG: thioredoxin family protein [Terriglobia bacterium]